MVDLDEAIAFAKAFRHLAKEPYVRVAHPGLKDGLVGIDPKALKEIADLGVALVAELRAARGVIEAIRVYDRSPIGVAPSISNALAVYDKVTGEGS